MTGRMLRMVMVAVAVAAMSAPAAQAVVPVNGGMAGGTEVTVNASAGDQTDPHVSGDLVTYTDVNTGKIRYYDLVSGADLAVPGPLDGVDTLSDVSGSQIAFVRLNGTGDRSVRVYDVASGTLVSFDHGFLAYEPFEPAIGGTTVALVDGNTGNDDIMVGDTGAPTAAFVNLSNSAAVDVGPDVAAQGDLVVWMACNASFVACDIYKATRTAGVWGPADQVTNTPATADENPHTDGTTIAYDTSPTGDIYLQPVAGGPPTQLELPGIQRNPNISDGVVSFENFDRAQTDIFVYVIATNTVYRVTDTPYNEVLNGVAVLPNGDVHVTWAAENEGPNVHDILARTFRLPAVDSTPPSISHAITGSVGDNGWYTSDVDLTWAVSEPESPGSLTKTGCVDQSITADQAATTYSCTASSDGGTAGPVDVTIKRDATAPTVAFTRNAGTYDVAQTVAIGCSASDNLSGLVPGCLGVNAPAYTVGLGSSTTTRSARDNAGNVGLGATSFTVVVTPSSLCTLTKDFVQSSAAYRALSPAGQHAVDISVAAACAFLMKIGPQLVPSQKAQFIKAYKGAVAALARAGWLTSSQAATLDTFADGL